ncbi:polypyrimidine tract-binding protein homolog 3 [Tanacetum coccineum]|uniref:Polypyrimidine tract-binding protein homolog 3 n=1 Tax=Tanacetum coccineum TaxID=301880 RepID=A0ABQ4YNE6_9ASTR
MFDEYFKPSLSVVSQTISATTLSLDTVGATSSTTIDQDAQSPSTTPNTKAITTLIQDTNVEEPNHENKDAEFDRDTFTNPFAPPETSSDESSTRIPNRILPVTIHHMLYPIIVEVLHQVFFPYGYVEKVVTFEKSAGQLLDILFSSTYSVSITPECHSCKKFAIGILQTHHYLQSRRTDPPKYGEAGAAAIAAAFGGGLPLGISGTNDRCTLLASRLNPDMIDEDQLFNLFSLYGNIVRIKLLRKLLALFSRIFNQRYTKTMK